MSAENERESKKLGRLDTSVQAPMQTSYVVTCWVNSPLGPLRVTADPEGIRSIDWSDVTDGTDAKVENQVVTPGFVEGSCSANSEVAAGLASSEDDQARATAERWVSLAAKQLSDYFLGTRRDFSVPLRSEGTPFQKAVWRALCDIPYGETRSYLDIATAIGKPTAVRAVGQANRANPIPVMVPCHRVIGKNGQLVGYAGAQVHLKERLLKLEREAVTLPLA